MAKREYIQRHLLIIKKLRNSSSTFENLQKYLAVQQELTGDNFTMSQRTFQRDVKEIYTIYGIEITYNKKEGCYEIKEEEEDKPFERIIEAFEMLSALNFSNRVSANLIVEKRATKGTEHMQRTLKPIAIKEAKNRWYLICLDTDLNEIRNFGLDRIVNLEITSQKFKQLEYDVAKEYRHAFGIETYEPATKIVLNFNAFQAKYIKTLPLHHSQTIVWENDERCQVEYFMHPTHDFIMEIMKYGETVKVEEPTELKENIKNRILEMVKIYEN